tara:strand:+ start:7385 stop:7570 length:186 start_codon:yes stop_codon:yes gene_type:complete
MHPSFKAFINKRPRWLKREIERLEKLWDSNDMRTLPNTDVEKELKELRQELIGLEKLGEVR